MKEIDWLELWRELVLRKLHPKTEKLVERYKDHGQKQKKARQSAGFCFKRGRYKGHRNRYRSRYRALDNPLAKRIKRVTSIEPTSGMEEMLKENLKNARLRNVEILAQTWKDATPSMHDIVVCAHGMYASEDMAAFISKMERYTRKTCYMAVRIPPAEDILSELSFLKIYGSRHDSPDSVIAYNALYTMGIHTNVLVENTILNWVNKTVEDAFVRAKRHLRLVASERAYDNLIYSTLQRPLTLSDGIYMWPDGMRSALLWWNPAHET